MRNVILALVTGAVLIAVSGCRSVEPEGRAAPAGTVWNQEQMEAHLRILNSEEVDGRGTGTHGYARAAEYVAAQMAAYKLQPAIGNEYRLLYSVPLNYVQTSLLAVAGRDTLYFGPGVDFLADARSDSGLARVRRLLYVQSDTLDDTVERLAEDTAVLISSDRQSGVLLEQLRDAGADVVFIEGQLAPSQAKRRVRGLLVIQLTPTTVEYIQAGLESARAEDDPDAHLVVQVVTGRQQTVGAINVLGYLGGKHPVLSEELVIVCADLDAMGRIGGVSTVDYKRFGTDVAALLEVARVQAEAARVFGVPDRTLLFAAWAGGLLDHAGFQGYLNRPVWPLEATRAIIYLGLDPKDEPRLREQLAGHGILLYVIHPPGSLANPGVRLVPSLAQTRMAVSGEAVVEIEVDMSQTFERASLLAETMAEETNDLLLRLAVMASPASPVRESDLRQPVTELRE